MKLIAYSEEVLPLFEKAGIADNLDEACVKLDKAADASNFIKAARTLRFWEREKPANAA